MATSAINDYSFIKQINELNFRDRSNSLQLESVITKLEKFIDFRGEASQPFEVIKFKEKLKTELPERLDLIERVNQIFSLQLTHLDRNALSVIFGFLDFRSLIRIKKTCKMFNNLVNNDPQIRRPITLSKIHYALSEKKLTVQEKNNSLHVIARHELEAMDVLDPQIASETFEVISDLGLYHLTSENVESLIGHLRSHQKTPKSLLISDAPLEENQLNELLQVLFDSHKPLSKLYLHRIQGLNGDKILERYRHYKENSMKHTELEIIEQPINAFVLLSLDGNLIPFQDFMNTFAFNTAHEILIQAFQNLPVSTQDEILSRVCIGRGWKYPERKKMAIELFNEDPKSPLIAAAINTTNQTIFSQEGLI